MATLTPERLAHAPVRDYWPTDGWRSSPPEAQGLDAEPLARMMEVIEEQDMDVHGVVVVCHGYIVAEAYFGNHRQDSMHALYSVTKSVVSALIGIALERGDLGDVEAPVLDLVPGYERADGDPGKRAITVKHLLTMSSGLAWQDGDDLSQMTLSRDWVQYVLDRPLVAEPGSEWNYNSGGYHVLSAVVQEVSGMSTMDYAQDHLFEPLGIEEVNWETDRSGTPIGGWGLWMTPRDMARFGLLYLSGGQWDGVQIVSPEWVAASTERYFQIADPLEPWDLYYGYGWWLHDIGPYAAHGLYGQFIYVLPEQDMVVVFVSGLQESEFVQPELLIQHYVMPAVLSLEE